MIPGVSTVRPHQPVWARSINWMGARLRSLGIDFCRYDLDGLIARARHKTGLTDLGSDDFRAPLEIYISALDREARLSALGRWLIRTDILDLLETRLRLVDLERTNPEIFARDVKAPIFITGAPRSGTSILHRLLGADPGNRIPLIWEALFPCPPQGKDDRFERADRLMRKWTSIVPDVRRIHDVRGDLPSECGMMMNASGLRDQLAISVRAPSYEARVFGPDADLTEAYKWHRKVLQVLQWQRPGRWILKAPSHMGNLQTLFAVYPDARIIQTHRDPLKVLPSASSLVNALSWVRSDSVDFDAIRQRFSADGMAMSLDRMRAFRESGGIDPDRFHDVAYDDLMRQPLREIEKIYERFAMTLTQDALSRIDSALRHAPKDVHGKHDYSFAMAGWDIPAMREKFTEYQSYYGVRSEV